MKKKDIEIQLQQIPPHPNPSPELEQYSTPAPIATELVYGAAILGDIVEKDVTDLGCGTGILATGAALLGAKTITGIDVDSKSIQIAQKYAEEHSLTNITFHEMDIKNYDAKCDTIIMNPPFGAQKSNLNADRRFIEKAVELSPITYSLHMSQTIPFLEKMMKALECEITHTQDYIFPIKAQFHFHKRPIQNIPVTLIRIQRKDISKK